MQLTLAPYTVKLNRNKMNEAVFKVWFGYGQNEVTLIILPQKHHFKIIYFGGIARAVHFVDTAWLLANRAEIESGDLYLYIPNLKNDRLKIGLNENTFAAIGKQIEMHYLNDERL